MIRSIVAVLLVAIGTPVTAGVQFAVFDGPTTEQVGVGGTKISRNGVDFWTTGTPPRRYRILGILTDSRYEAWGKKAVGSDGIAKVVRKLGGDAVVVLGQQDRSSGAYVIPVGTSFVGGDDVKTVTQLQVVKYLTEGGARQSTPTPPSVH